jgi:hypothetical protein
LAIFVAMLSFNLIGDGLRDLSDPKVVRRLRVRRSRRTQSNASPQEVSRPAENASPKSVKPPRPALAASLRAETGGKEDGQ